jgi:hypothetical protein
MAAFQVNLTISAGLSFRQEFTLANADKSPVNLTGASFTGAISKNERSINAELSTAAVPVYERIYFECEVVNAATGVYCIKLTPEQTNKLLEGKYVYNVVMKNVNSELISVAQGLAFVEVAFGAPFEEIVVVEEETPTNATQTNGLVLGANYIA